MSTPNETEELLRGEVERFRRTTSRYRLIGYPLVIILGLHLTWIGYRLKTEVLNPYRLADTLAVRLDNQAPSVIAGLEEGLSAEANRSAERANAYAMAMVPVFGHSAREKIEQLSNTMPLLDQSSKELLDKYFAVNSAALRDAFARHEQNGFVRSVVNDAVKEITGRLHRNVRTVIDGKEVRGPHEISVTQLEQFNELLTRLRHTPTVQMSTRERLQRRLIVAWTGVLRRYLQMASNTGRVPARWSSRDAGGESGMRG